MFIGFRASTSALYKTLCVGLIMIACAIAARAASTTVVISQVYGGGGNATSVWKNDFIELHNISSSPVSVTGWSVQYSSGAGTSWTGLTTLSGAIAPGAYYLVQESAGAGGSMALPTPDASGSIALSATAGKVALVNNTTALTSNSATGPSIVDFVGFGAANAFEGSGPTAAPANATSVQRGNAGSTDTDNNAADFSVQTTITPRNSSTTPYVPAQSAVSVNVETAADGSGSAVATQTLSVGASITVYSVTRDASNQLIANAAATWSLTNLTGGIVAGDLVAAADNKSAVFTPHAAGTAVIHSVVSGLNSVDSGMITASSAQTNPALNIQADNASVIPGQTINFTVTLTPGANPASTGLAVQADFSALGGGSSQALNAGANNTFAGAVSVPASIAGGAKTVSFHVSDAQSRTADGTFTVNVRGNLTIFHTNDTHARVTPHKWVIPQHSNNPVVQFEDVGGAAYLGGEELSLVTATPDALVLDAGDISEGNPIGDWNGPGSTIGSFGNGTIVEYFKLLDSKLRAIPGRGGRGLDAMVVGNHDIRDMTYINNLKNQTAFPVISANICVKGTHTPYFPAYVIVNLNGNKIGILGYTTESSDSSDPNVNNAIDVVKCDWSSTDSTKIHYADLVNDLRNNQGCNLVILLTHMGHSGLCTPTSSSSPILVDNAAAKLPEVAITGHWHTFCDTVWQPSVLNYKTIFTEAGSFMHYVGELRINGLGQYVSNANYPIRDSAITPDADIASLIQTREDEYAAANPPYAVNQVIGYSADDLLLDNYMKWWSSDEYPWSGDNTAGGWICDAMQWKATALFGSCDISIESGGGVRSDIPAGPVTYSQIYETFPWADDVIYMVKMTGQELWDYFKLHGCDVGMSHGWFVTAVDGVPTSITYNGQPIDLSHTYNVAINNYMYGHDTVPFSDPAPSTSTYLARTALVEYTAQFTQASPYHSGGARYSLNTDFSGGYRAVVTMMNDNDSSTTFDDAFIRILNATPETLAHRGTKQVPNDLINADGTANAQNRLTESELYRSYLGFRTGALKPGDIIETWGKGSFYQGDPEFVDQEGIQSAGQEFKIVGHDDSVAQASYMSSINSFMDDWHKNHYVSFFARKTGSSTVADQNGTTLQVYDVTAYTAKTLPGAVGDLLKISGVPTSENFSLRFRADNVVTAASVGVNSYPPSSQVNSVSPSQSTAPLNLTATATPSTGAGVTTYTLAPLADAQVISANPTSNQGTSTNLFDGSAATGSFQNERTWLRFDLSSLPTNANIVSAKLNMYCWKTTGASLPTELHSSSTDSWSETGITWNNQPTFNGTLDTVTLNAGSLNVWYQWDATSFVQSEWTGDKAVSLMVKSTTEGSTDATPPSYGFDSKEYNSGANSPYLQVNVSSGTAATTVTQVQFYYRYSSDNATWTAWNSFQTSNGQGGNWTASFSYPNGNGYYQFYSIATDSIGNVEPAPSMADTSVFYTAGAQSATVTLSNINTTFDGSAKPVTVTTSPVGLSVAVTYNGSATAPVHAGTYAVVATITDPNYSGSGSGTETISQAVQTINFPAIVNHAVGDSPFALNATTSSGLDVAYTSSDTTVATINGSTVTIVGAGTTTMIAAQTGNGDYSAASPVNQPLVVSNGNGGGTGSNGGTDTPAMPPWAMALFAGLLVLLARIALIKHRTKSA
jgi:2',3'-cyclic-nucleotide 2'-phosphodiesterase (5'-nucleotidase family)